MSMNVLTTNENAVYSFFPCSCICNMETQLSEWTGSHILLNKMQGQIQAGVAGLVKPVKFHKTHFLGWCKTLGVHQP